MYFVIQKELDRFQTCLCLFSFIWNTYLRCKIFTLLSQADNQNQACVADVSLVAIETLH